MKKIILLTTWLLSINANAAVHINDEQTGEAILLPFYTVANGLNTYINISNDRNETKIIRVVLREGVDSKRALSLNVFLSPFDSWTATLGVNQNKAAIIAADDSCSSLGDNNTIYDLWTDEVDTDPQDPLTEEEILARIGAGWVEIFELATVANEQATLSAAIQNRDCAFLNQQYESGIWLDDLNFQLGPTSGGLHASITLIDVLNGFMTQTPATHFADFYPTGTIAHTAHTDELPNLSSADTTSLLIHDGEAISSGWSTGYQAITALLMKEEISSEYNITPGIGAWTEWVMTMPTLRFYQNNDDTAPFSFVGDGMYGGAFDGLFFFPFPGCRFGIDLYNRMGALDLQYPGCGAVDPTPPSVNGNPLSIWVLKDNQNFSVEPILAHAEARNIDAITVFDVPQYDEGIAKFYLASFSQATLSGINPADSEPMQYKGLPVIGFAFTRFINANAQPGLLANYGAAQPYRSSRSISPIE